MESARRLEPALKEGDSSDNGDEPAAWPSIATTRDFSVLFAYVSELFRNGSREEALD
jgi:hypothetical protein